MRMLALLAAAGPGLVFGASGGVVLDGSIRARSPVRAVDAATRNETGIAYLTDRRPTGVASWLTVGKPSGGLVAFTIRVPRGAAPGEYFAGLAVGGAGGYVVGVEIDVAGPPVARFVVGAVHAGRTRLYLHVTNAGDVALAPQGAVSIADSARATVEQVAFRMATFLPHTSVDYPLPFRHRLAPGSYTASVRLTYAGVTSSAAPQFVVPRRPTFTPRPPGPPVLPVAAARGASSRSRYVAGAVTALLGAAAGALLWRRRRPLTVTARPVAPELVPARCEGFHYWDVDWQRPQRGANGAVVYPHRCRRCGVEVLAVDIADAGRSCM
jgi:hypothetical protein